MITRLGCAAEDASFLMAAGFPTRWGPPDYLENCTAPKIFIQSTNDQYGPRAELEAMYERFAAPKELHWVEAADHFFAGALEELEEKVKAAAEQLDAERLCQRFLTVASRLEASRLRPRPFYNPPAIVSS